MSEYRLSLTAHFDDLCRKKHVLLTASEDIESEFFKFVKQQETCRQKWCAAEQRVKTICHEKDDLAERLATLDKKWMHTKKQLDVEIRKRMTLEKDKSFMDQNIKMVRNLLNDKNSCSYLNPGDREKLESLSMDYGGFSKYGDSPGACLSTIEESQASLSHDISWDDTADDLDTSYKVKNGSAKKRPSAPPIDEEENTLQEKKRTKSGKTPIKSPSKSRRNKKHRRSNSASIITTTTVTVNDGHSKAQFTHDDVKRHDVNNTSLRKFPSAGDIKAVDSEEEITPKTGRYSRDYKTPGRASSLYRSNSAWSLNRPHDFVKVAVLKPEQCIWCDKYMLLRQIKCRECKVTAHPECKELVPTPCVPHSVTPGINKHDAMTISCYAPSQPPYIPAIVIHCVRDVETRGLEEEGLYRRCGNEREIKKLKADFLTQKGMPNLASVSDIHVVCGCLKDFLRGLKEPLLTAKLRSDFIRAAQNSDEDEALSGTIQATSHLPNANRDTLAFLMLHLQRISECEECRMTQSNLAIVFGPTIVGYSSAEPDPMQMVSETNQTTMVMERLLSLSNDYWDRLINVEEDYRTPGNSYYTQAQTPEVLRSILGPVNTPGDSSTVDRNRASWNTPRFGSVTRNQRRNITQYFASPIQ